MKLALPILIASLLTTLGCSKAYYSTMETFGVHKREIMVDRVKEARDTQDQAKEQFLTTLEQFRNVVNFEGGDLEEQYDNLQDTLADSEAAAAAVRDRIAAVEDVSEALFDEWQAELDDYTSDSLRRASERTYQQTRQRYEQLMQAMHRAESKLEPVLNPLRDQVLFLKHNLNARAIAGLDVELQNVEESVDALVREMETAIAQANAFIAALEE